MAVKVHELLQKKVLVTRESARAIEPQLTTAAKEEGAPLELDFIGVDALTPSFMDEVLAIISRVLAETNASRVDVRVLNPPTRLSSKFEAVGRAYELDVRELPDGAWLISRYRRDERTKT